MNELATQATPAESFLELGVVPAPDARALYLDMVKRTVCNLIYEDIALWAYDDTKQFEPLNRFDLKRRLSGEDMPTEAHTMVGWRRLCNIEDCAREVILGGVPGDFVETGVLRGGSSIFMRAALKAYGATDRRIFACDTFGGMAEKKKEPPLWVRKAIFRLLSLATRVPSEGWRLGLYRILEKGQSSFPRSANPSKEWIDFTMEMVRYLEKNQKLLKPKDRVSLDAVKSHFARYGLLDSQVVFLKGFFSDTLSGADIREVAILRCDGDSYESTHGVLETLYPKVSRGGYVIIDDYGSFSDCKTAVDDYRRAHGIHDELVAIDRIASYWKKS
jgi:hypothetical protein